MNEIAKDIYSSDGYKKIRDELIEQLKKAGTTQAYFLDLVDDYMRMYVVKSMLMTDIEERGAAVESTDAHGNKYVKKNDSVDQLVRVNHQMVGLLDRLGIKPAQGDAEETL